MAVTYPDTFPADNLSSGETDFVVIAPPYGIFILEVKSGGVDFDGSNWIFINRKREQYTIVQRIGERDCYFS
jgi:hypothetical protein